jgi:hypothetical protein
LNPLTEEDEITKLRIEATASTDPAHLIKIIDTLEPYAKGEFGEKAIESLYFIVNSEMNEDVKSHALDVIKKIKEQIS